MASLEVPTQPRVFGDLGLALTTRVIADAACLLACTVFFLGTAVTACRRGRSFVNNTARRLTLFLIASLWIMAASDASNFFPRMAEGTSCKLLGMIRQFCTCNVALWTWVVSYYLYDTIMTQRSSSLSEVKVHIGVLAASVLATAVPVIGDTYGYSGSWCWINPEVPLGIFFQFATYYVPLWIIIVSVCVMYTRVGMRVYKVKQQTARYLPRAGLPAPTPPPLQGGFGPTPTMNGRPSSTTPKPPRRAVRTPRELFRYTLKKLGPFPLIFVVCWIFPTARRVYQDAVGRPPQWLVVAQAVSTPLQGVLFVLFFYRRPIRHMFRCLCSCCASRSSDGPPSPSSFGGSSHRTSTSSTHQYTRKGDGSYEYVNDLAAGQGRSSGTLGQGGHRGSRGSRAREGSNGLWSEKSGVSHVAMSPPSGRRAGAAGRSVSAGGERVDGLGLLRHASTHSDGDGERDGEGDGGGGGHVVEAAPGRAHAGSAPSDLRRGETSAPQPTV